MIRSETEELFLPELSELQRQVLIRAVSFAGYP
jgi:hypothetical protein